MHNVIIAGAGKIGSLIACLLIESGDYHVTLADKQFNGGDITRLRTHYPQLQTIEVDVQDQNALSAVVRDQSFNAIISSLPFYCNITVARVAREFGLHYFDLTEDVTVTNSVCDISQGAATAFAPQCGLAPGFINIVADTLMRHFETLDTVKLRVGALPQHPSNALHYSLTWSTDGLINEYGNPCQAVDNGEVVMVLPLEGLEEIQIDGWLYEAFNTSGGLGNLAKTYAGKIRNLNYKTLRYPGHCEQIRLLMNDLRLNEDRETLKRILERAIPKTYQDVVIVSVSVVGTQFGQLIEENYVKKVYPQTIAGLIWSAIQVTTASGVCSVVDLILSHNQDNKYQGFVAQERFTLEEITSNRFGKCYK